MQQESAPTGAASSAPSSWPSSWQRLFHRWFVEYNPLYLLSAMLVLGGMILLSRGLAHEGSLYGEIGVAAIAEVYSAALIAGAALLMRVGQRRSAVMLALVTVLYQCDLTLHTETCPNLGWIGALATNTWLALFVAKLVALAWAMKIRLPRVLLATATLGATGLAIFPYVISRMENPRASSALVMVWLFALSAIYRAGVSSSGGGSSVTTMMIVDLDEWGRTVLRRCVRATWLLWALLLALHVLFWSTQYKDLGLRTLLPVVPLIAVQWIRRESRMWCAVTATLLVVGVHIPSAFSITAVLTACVLTIRAFTAARSAQSVVTISPPHYSVTPYRIASDEGEPPSPTSPITTLITPIGPAAMRRLLVAAGVALYLAIWTSGWSGGPWPAHIVVLDVALAAALLFSAWKMRVRVAIVPVVAASVHFAIKAQLVPTPHSLLEWGGASVGLGFALLIASLAASYWFRPKRTVVP